MVKILQFLKKILIFFLGILSIFIFSGFVQKTQKNLKFNFSQTKWEKKQRKKRTIDSRTEKQLETIWTKLQINYNKYDTIDTLPFQFEKPRPPEVPIDIFNIWKLIFSNFFSISIKKGFKLLTTPYAALNLETKEKLQKILVAEPDFSKKLDIYNNWFEKAYQISKKIDKYIPHLIKYKITKIESKSLVNFLISKKKDYFYHVLKRFESLIAKSELISLGELPDYEKKIKNAIEKVETKNIWTKIQTDYYDDLKKYEITELTPGSKELVNTVKETKTTNYIDLSSATKTELKKIAQIDKWEEQLKTVITKLVWKKIWKFIPELRKYNISRVENKSLEFLILVKVFPFGKDVFPLSFLEKKEWLSGKKSWDNLLFEQLKPEARKDLFALKELPDYEKKIKNAIDQARIDANLSSNKEELSFLAWNMIKTTYYDDLKKYNITGLTPGGDYLAKIVKIDKTTAYADLNPETKRELVILIKDANWESNLQTLILTKKAEAVWIKIQTDYYNDLKTYQIQELTPGSKELVNTVKETKTTSYIDLSSTTKTELKKLVTDPSWEDKLKTLFSNKEAQRAWEKIKTDYFIALKTFQITSIDNRDLVSLVTLANGYESYQELSDFVISELKTLITLSGWETKLNNLINQKKNDQIPAIWTKIKTTYLDNLKKFNVQRIVSENNTIELTSTVTETKATVYKNLKPETKNELKTLATFSFFNWENQFKILITSHFAAEAWEKIKTDYFIDLKNLQITRLVNTQKNFINLINQSDSSQSYSELSKLAKIELKALIANPGWEAWLNRSIYNKKLQRAWEKIQTTYYDDLKRYGITELTSGGNELAKIVAENKNTPYANLKPETKRELKTLIKNKDYVWETKLQNIIQTSIANSQGNEDFLWTKIQTDYYDDLKKYKITELTSGGNEFANIVTETKTTSYDSLNPKTKQELKKLVGNFLWEEQLKTLILTKKAAAAWAKIKNNYSDILQSLDFQDFFTYGTEFVNVILEIKTTSYDDLTPNAKAELKFLVADSSWEKNLKALILAKKGELVWNFINLKLAKLKEHQINQVATVSITNLLNADPTTAYPDLDSAIKTELSNLAGLVDYQNQIIRLMIDSSLSQQIWAKVKKYIPKLKKNFPIISIENKSLLNLAASDENSTYKTLSSEAKKELKELLKLGNYETKINAKITEFETANPDPILVMQQTEKVWNFIKNYIITFRSFQITKIESKSIKAIIENSSTDNFTDLSTLTKAELFSLKDLIPAQYQKTIISKKYELLWQKIINIEYYKHYFYFFRKYLSDYPEVSELLEKIGVANLFRTDPQTDFANLSPEIKKEFAFLIKTGGNYSQFIDSETRVEFENAFPQRRYSINIAPRYFQVTVDYSVFEKKITIIFFYLWAKIFLDKYFDTFQTLAIGEEIWLPFLIDSQNDEKAALEAKAFFWLNFKIISFFNYFNDLLPNKNIVSILNFLFDYSILKLKVGNEDLKNEEFNSAFATVWKKTKIFDQLFPGTWFRTMQDLFGAKIEKIISLKNQKEKKYVYKYWDVWLDWYIVLNKKAKIIWEKIQTRYISDMKKFAIQGITPGGKELANVLLEQTIFYHDLFFKIYEADDAGTEFFFRQPKTSKIELLLLAKGNSDWEEKLKTLISAKKREAAWTFVKTKLAELKECGINQVEKVTITHLLEVNPDTAYADLDPNTKTELTNLANLATYQTEIKQLITSCQEAPKAWEKIQTTYYDDLKKYNITELTPGGNELAKIVNETKTTPYANLKPETKRELKTLITVPSWETKLQTKITSATKKEEKKPLKTILLATLIPIGLLITIGLFFLFFFLKKKRN